MSNLGFYENMTTFISKVGGPGRFKLLCAGAFALVFIAGHETKGSAVESKVIDFVVSKTKESKQLFSSFSKQRVAGSGNKCAEKTFVVYEDCDCHNDLILKEGDIIRIIRRDGDVALISLNGEDNPFYVSFRALQNCLELRNEKQKGKMAQMEELDESIDYDSLEQHKYSDSGENVFYTCPKCGGEYLASFIVEESGETMCIDCWSSEYGD